MQFLQVETLVSIVVSPSTYSEILAFIRMSRASLAGVEYDQNKDNTVFFDPAELQDFENLKTEIVSLCNKKTDLFLMNDEIANADGNLKVATILNICMKLCNVGSVIKTIKKCDSVIKYQDFETMVTELKQFKDTGQSQKFEGTIRQWLSKCKSRSDAIVFVVGTSLIPNKGNQTQKIPPTTSVKDKSVNSAA